MIKCNDPVTVVTCTGILPLVWAIRHDRVWFISRNTDSEGDATYFNTQATQGESHTCRWEGVSWIQGHHDLNTPQVQALLTAFALSVE